MRKPFTGAGKLLTWSLICAALSFTGCGKKNDPGADTKTPDPVTPTAPVLMSGNPILPLFTADPDILYDNGKYYIYPTATGPNASQFHAYSSTDLLNWVDEGIILDLANVAWAKTDGWAPGIIAHNGKYYFYFTAAKKVGVAVGNSPKGPFLDKGSALATGVGPDPIDPMVFMDTDGKAYLYWGNTKLNIQQLNPDMISFTGPLSHNQPGNYFEAPYVIKRNGVYYLMYSVNDFGNDDYHVEYATSTNPMGPWNYKGRISSPGNGIKGPGHNAVIRKPGCAEEYYFVYHRRTSNNIHERRTAIDRMFFDANGDIMPINVTTAGVVQSPGTAGCLVPNPVADGVYTIRSAAGTSGLYLDIPNCATGNADVRVAARQASCAGQKWAITYQGNGFYKIISEQSTRKSLDLNSCGLAPGTDVGVYDALNNDCQLWRIESTGNGNYRIMAKASNNVLDVEGTAAAGANVRSWSWNGTNNQLWKFETP